MHASGEKIAVLTCYDAIFAHLLDAPIIFLLTFSLPSENRNAGFSDGSCSVILSAENVATGPLNLKETVICN